MTVWAMHEKAVGTFGARQGSVRDLLPAVRAGNHCDRRALLLGRFRAAIEAIPFRCGTTIVFEGATNRFLVGQHIPGLRIARGCRVLTGQFGRQRQWPCRKRPCRARIEARSPCEWVSERRTGLWEVIVGLVRVSVAYPGHRSLGHIMRGALGNLSW